MNRISRPVFTLSVCAVVLLTTVIAWASITGTISGVVTDPNGAVVPGVTAVATEEATGVQTTVVTDAKGFYSFPTLAIGKYDVTFIHQGFSDFRETAVTINVNSAVRIDVKMQVGAVTNTVAVRSDTLHVETESSQMGMVIEGAKMVALPLNGRSYLSLIPLQPGVSPVPYSSTNGYTASPGVSGNLNAGTWSISGARGGSNGYMVNGADAQEGAQSVAALVPNLDSIAQFRIITNNFNAEYGNYSGGQVNVVTKSGANQFHGDAFEFLRNTDLDAKSYYNSERGPYKQNIFGGTFGGPIRRDHAFFFVDYQGTRQQIGQSQTISVPSLADRTGNVIDQATSLEGSSVAGGYWANLLSNRLGYAVIPGEPYYTAGCAATTTCVFPNAVIPQSAWDPVSANTLKYIPTPNAVINGQPSYETSAFPSTVTDDKGGLRVDLNTRYGALFGYYFRDKYDYVNPYNSVNIPGWAQGFPGITQMANLGLTTAFGNSMVNDIRLVYLRDSIAGGVGIQGEGVKLSSLGFNTPWNNTGGLAAVDPKQEGVPLIVLNNYAFGASAGAQYQANNTFQILDNVTKIVGTHSIQFGADLHYDQINELYAAGINNGFFDFNGQETGLDYADYLLGAVTAFYQGGPTRLDSRSKYIGIYAQDSWRAFPTLTLNYGLRWEYDTPWYDTQNKLSTLIPGEQSLSFPGAPLGLVVPGDPGVPKTLSKVQHLHFAPRFGLVYAPDISDGWLGKVIGGPGKFSIRTGYGLFYQAFADVEEFGNAGGAPYGEFWGSPVPPLFNSPYIDRATGHFEGIKFPFKFPPTNVSPSNPDTTYNWAQAEPLSSKYFYPGNVLPYVQEWELSLQRQFGTQTVLTVSYVGTVGRHLMTLEEANPGNQALCLQLHDPANLAPGQTPCGPGGENATYITSSGQTIPGTRQPFGSQNFSSNTYEISAASSSYNSLQISLQHQEKYASFLIAYTKAKAIGNSSDEFDNTNPINPALSRGLNLADVPNYLAVSYTVQLPFYMAFGKGAVARRFTAGWALNGISTFQAGSPVQIKESDDQSLAGANGTIIDEPNFSNNGSPLFLDKNPRHCRINAVSCQPYFNPNYFTREPLGHFGNSPPEFFVGPGSQDWDAALVKDTELHTSTNLEIRAEAYNVFNHANFGNPNGNFNAGAGNFGYVNSAGPGRVMQVALKLLF